MRKKIIDKKLYNIKLNIEKDISNYIFFKLSKKEAIEELFVRSSDMFYLASENNFDTTGLNIQFIPFDYNLLKSNSFYEESMNQIVKWIDMYCKDESNENIKVEMDQTYNLLLFLYSME